jgi:hypothetical protein
VTLVAAGTCSITATRPGNSAYAAAAPVTVTFTVDPVFADTATGDTAAENQAIDLMATFGITSGCSSTPFDYCPNESVTRGQWPHSLFAVSFTVIISPILHTAYFTDVPAGAQFFQYIQKMKDLGITSGETATTYGPGDPVTRGQMAVL